jgi:hypothetical protein
MPEFYGVVTIPSNRILSNVCTVVARPKSSTVEKREFFPCWPRFTAAIVPALSLGGYAFGASGSGLCGFALRRRRFARRASRNRSALIRSLSCASFAKCLLRSIPTARAPDAKSPAKAQAA